MVGLTRSEASAAKLSAAGAQVWRGDLRDLDGLREAAAEADGVIHLAFDHEAMTAGDFAGAGDTDLAVVRAFGEVLAGTGKPLVGTSGTAMVAGPGLDRAATEEDVMPGGYRIDAENELIGFADRGIRTSVVRLPPTVHSSLDKHGFVPVLIAAARKAGRSGYLGDGVNRWPAVHTLDAARLYRLAMEKAPAGSRLHAVGDEGVLFRQIAEAIGRHLGLPTESIPAKQAEEHFGFWPASRRWTTRRPASTPSGCWTGSRSIPACSPTSTRATTSRTELLPEARGQVLLDEVLGLAHDLRVALGVVVEGQLQQPVRGLDRDRHRQRQARRVQVDVLPDEVGERVRDDPVVVPAVVEQLPVHHVAEVDLREARHGPVHLQVDVQHRVDDVPPVPRVLAAQPFAHGLHEPVEVALRQRPHDRPLVGEKLVQRPDGDPRALRDEGGGQRVITDLVDELGARVQHLLDPLRAALLDGLPAKRGRRRLGLRHVVLLLVL
ncbi:NAD-dependent epimerase/dehydratase [Amycolatopsis methanolica 239]|uniref:NAD-dependent epimerase/dehydratase n=1 Tax=Amycolatopsis methanolica 239 TaxID=1068978 RepID=A0A076MMI6_AMYME|nr:NAD-dependent epimerase/dehydratase [Amycolatopsis methanolica 239]